MSAASAVTYFCQECGDYFLLAEDCPGSHVPAEYRSCSNCDDRKCMGCVMREYYHTCANDCPICCVDIAG